MSKPLDLKPVPTPPPQAAPLTQENYIDAMAQFYASVGDAVMNLIPIAAGIKESLDGLLVELADLKDNYNRQGKQEGWLNDAVIEERENESDEPGA